jgi:myo-inositol-1(or 4)-monophosphatase
MATEYKKEFKLAQQIARNAGQQLMSVNQKEIISSKGKDTKAIADIKTNQFILEALAKASSKPIISEESDNNVIHYDDAYWIIDPIDGTLNYTRDIPLSCVSIALWKNSQPVFGVIFDFNRNEMISGYIGTGAWLNSEKIMRPKPIKKEQAILATGISTYINLENDQGSVQMFIKEITEYKKVRLIGSAALSLAYVGLNRFNAYKEKDIKLWDVAAGVAIINSLKIPFEMKDTGNYCYDLFAYNHL